MSTPRTPDAAPTTPTTTLTTTPTTTPTGPRVPDAPPMRTRRASIRTRLTLTLIAAGALPLAMLGASMVRIQRDGLVKSEQLHELAVIDHVTELLEGSLREVATTNRRVGLVLTDPRLTDDDAKIELARELLAGAPSMAQVAIYLPDGRYVDAISRATGAPAAPREIASLVSGAAGARNEATEPRWLPVEASPQGPRLRVLDPVRRDGALRAWVLGTVDLDGLSARLHSLSLDRFDNRADGIVLLDEQARVLAESALARPGTAGRALSGTDLLAAASLTPSLFRGDLAVSREYVAQGEPMVGSLRTIPTRGFAVLVRRPARAVFTSLALAQRSLAAAAAFFLLVAILFASWLALRTVRPVQRLMGLARAYGARRFETRSDVATGDELELLGGQMMTMADDIVRSEREIVRRAEIQANLSRFLPSTVAESIASGERSIALGGERRRVTVLFADVVSFTPFVESRDPALVVAFLNELFGVMTEVVFRYEGTVDKFIGDSLMAVFGAPSEQVDHSERAVSCAEDLHRFVESTADRWRERYGIAPQLAIGISTGDALVGNLGSESRMEYTAIGDTVNVAARLESLAQAGQTLVTDDVRVGAESVYEFASLGERTLRGRAQPVALFELVR